MDKRTCTQTDERGRAGRLAGASIAVIVLAATLTACGQAPSPVSAATNPQTVVGTWTVSGTSTSDDGLSLDVGAELSAVLHRDANEVMLGWAASGEMQQATQTA